MDFWGRLCFISARMVLSAISGGSGSLVLFLPFTLGGTGSERFVGECNWQGLTLPAGYTQVVVNAGGGTNFLRVSRSGSGLTLANVQVSELAAPIDIRYSITVPVR